MPDPFRGGASCALIIDGRVLQFDFGRQVMENLMLMGVSPMKIELSLYSEYGKRDGST